MEFQRPFVVSTNASQSQTQKILNESFIKIIKQQISYLLEEAI